MRFTPLILNSVFPCNSWFKWWVVGNFLADPSKVCPSHQRPLLRGLNRFFIIHAVRRTANDRSNWHRPLTTCTTPLNVNSCLTISGVQNSLPAPGNDHNGKPKFSFPFLPHPQPWVRVQHPTWPVGLADWHVRPPLCFGKEWAADSFFDSEPTRGICTMRFKFFNFMQCRFSRVFFMWRCF